MVFENYWNETHKKYSTGKPVYDSWLDKYALILEKIKTPILDLGCGSGNDTLYLTEKGFSVIECKVGESDHVHCFVSAPPKISVTQIVLKM